MLLSPMCSMFSAVYAVQAVQVAKCIRAATAGVTLPGKLRQVGTDALNASLLACNCIIQTMTDVRLLP